MDFHITSDQCLKVPKGKWMRFFHTLRDMVPFERFRYEYYVLFPIAYFQRAMKYVRSNLRQKDLGGLILIQPTYNENSKVAEGMSKVSDRE